ncbi:MAG: hypothetical protein KQH79_15365 [Bacteroidetes bacterium]|nr:hypothetical protein [Bacteroidota bacterium]
MKKNILIILLGVVINASGFAQDITTVRANEDISDNLDLEAVASVFGDSKDLEDFEYKLNDPELRISNLDLNRDGYVDYLRVVENSENQTVLITIQAVLGKDLYQDVATIDVERDRNGRSSVQVVGDVYMYGPDYIIEPVYVYSPPVLVYLWGPTYRHWHSPYYWGYYPSHYHRWHTHSCNVYRRNVHVHINTHHNYYYPRSRRSSTAVHMHNKTRRNDYGRAYPNRSFSSRNSDVRNTRDLNARRGVGSSVSSRQPGSSVRSAKSRSSNASYSSNPGSSRSSSGRTYNSRKSYSRSSASSEQVTRSSNSRSYNKSGHSSSRSGDVRSGKSSSGKSVNRSGANSRSGNNRSGAGRNSSTSSGSGRGKRR